MDSFLYTTKLFTEITLHSIQSRSSSSAYDIYEYFSLKNMRVFIMHLGRAPIHALVKRPGSLRHTNITQYDHREEVKETWRRLQTVVQ